ncbi:TadE/TadG family type IV pilus assembly protein [Rhizobium sp. LCM 4573]|uniref:TadE/TadG family type IV pilus assembly protein n=1 Tax=Rhizobium sp. LCM 4573 TaxID=1848291 RepID=UPI0008DA330A|nr:TadE/TadG family type IV pilus assembly protein [Rhizobium sp. LCM 4573]OHV79117.1 hypothetical protein LCM4573_07395 [Rhizobium sp. LCM 4573]
MRLRALVADRRGMGAVEFALIAPLLLMLYITVFELTVGFSVSKRVSRAATSVADLVTQQATVNKPYLNTMLDVAGGLFVPYGTSGIAMKITGVKVDSSASAKVLWSWDQSGGKPYAAGSPVTVPQGMRSTETFLVRAEVSVPHQLLMFMPGLLPSAVEKITIRRESFFQQRLGKDITCSDC